jgi:outer membrane protein assembly factor BamB
MRYKWFPVVVLAAVIAWWLWRASYAQYQTLLHVLMLLVGVISIAAWFLLFGGGSTRLRRRIIGGLALAIVAFFLAFSPVNNGDMGVYRWRLRFASNADQQLQQLGSGREANDWHTTPSDYPRFLGNGYWAEVKGVELETDWQAHPPQELWRREIGAGWSAFAIVGDYAVTQEQRGENELVTCYRVQTGEPIWTHADATRFDPECKPASRYGLMPMQRDSIRPMPSVAWATWGLALRRRFRVTEFIHRAVLAWLTALTRALAM